MLLRYYQDFNSYAIYMAPCCESKPQPEMMGRRPTPSVGEESSDDAIQEEEEEEEEDGIPVT